MTSANFKSITSVLGVMTPPGSKDRFTLPSHHYDFQKRVGGPGVDIRNLNPSPPPKRFCDAAFGSHLG